MGRFIEQLKHAFALTAKNTAESPLPRGLERVAAEIVARGLETPAILLLETAHPLSFIAGQSLHAVRPFVAQFMNEREFEEVATALEDKRNVMRLIDRIEALARERG